MAVDISHIQEILKKNTIHAWVLTDIAQMNLPACDILQIPKTVHSTRRWFYVIGQRGEPVKITSAIESGILDHLPGHRHIYLGRDQMISLLETQLSDFISIAMEYSPLSRLPSASKVDAGTIELVRSINKNLVSSADLLQELTAIWNDDQRASHMEAATALRKIVEEAFVYIKSQTGQVTELDIQDFIIEKFKMNNLVTDHPPICATGIHSADPHYSANRESNATIKSQTIQLIDLWAKTNDRNSVYADITWTAFTGDTPGQEIQRVFDTVINARDTCLSQIKQAFCSRKTITGAEADSVCRNSIHTAGFGSFFTHRTGHSLGKIVHGYGANLDNFESCDDRKLMAGSGFTIEPGIYLPGKFGIRSEINVWIGPDSSVNVSGLPIQTKLICL